MNSVCSWGRLTWKLLAALQADPLNANVYIGSISPEVSDDELKVRVTAVHIACSALIAASQHEARAHARLAAYWVLVSASQQQAIMGIHASQFHADFADNGVQSYLEQFGQLLDMRVFRKNCYGFAQYAQHGDAVMAILGTSFCYFMLVVADVYLHVMKMLSPVRNAPVLSLLPADMQAAPARTV